MESVFHLGESAGNCLYLFCEVFLLFERMLEERKYPGNFGDSGMRTLEVVGEGREWNGGGERGEKVVIIIFGSVVCLHESIQKLEKERRIH